MGVTDLGMRALCNQSTTLSHFLLSSSAATVSFFSFSKMLIKSHSFALRLSNFFSDQFIYLNKKIKIAIPQPVLVNALSWNSDKGWIVVGGEDGLLKVRVKSASCSAHPVPSFYVLCS